MIARRAIAYQYAEYCLPDTGRIGWQIQTRRKSVPNRLALGHKRCIAGNARGRGPRQRQRFCAPVFRRDARATPARAPNARCRRAESGGSRR